MNHRVAKTWSTIKQVARLWMFVCVLCVCTGCTTGYWVDRGRDAADVFTFTVGPGVGAKARVGPIQVGLLHYEDAWGLRGGSLDSFDGPIQNPDGSLTVRTADADTFILSAESFERGDRSNMENIASRRGKEFATVGIGPFVWCVKSKEMQPEPIGINPQYRAQIDVVVGLGYGVRMGFNVGELIDLVLGFFGVDVYQDDLERKGE